MNAYYEFYSDLDTIINMIETLIDDCHRNWVNDEPFFTTSDEETEPF